MKNNIYKGVITALITPFENGLLDLESLFKIIDFQIISKVNAIVVAGSTGEGTSLSEKDYYSLIKVAIEHTNQRIPLIAGMTSSCTDSAVEKAKKLNNLGVYGIMCTAPHYVRPSQEGIVKHFTKIHDATEIPIMLYTHPGRTGVDLTDETIIELAAFDRIVALKDAGSDIQRPLRLSSKLKDFNFLCGDDIATLAYNAHGGMGCVSVAANIIPQYCLDIQKKWFMGDAKGAMELQQRLLPIYEALFSENNPIGVKCAASMLGFGSDEVLLPLIKAQEFSKQKIRIALDELGLNT